MGVVREDMRVAGVKMEDAAGRKKWKQMVHRGNP